METRLADFPSREEIGGHLLTVQQLQGKLEAARAKDQQREMEVEELTGKLAAAEMEKVAVCGDLDSMKEKHRRELEGRDAAARRECHLACWSLVWEYDAVLAVVKAKLLKKKEEKVTKIRLQEVRARIEALTEYNEAGYELEEEFERLKRHEVSLDVEYGLASVSVSSDFRGFDQPGLSRRSFVLFALCLYLQYAKTFLLCFFCWKNIYMFSTDYRVNTFLIVCLFYFWLH